MERILVTKPEFKKGIEVFSSIEDFECLPGPETSSEFVNMVLKLKIRYVIIGVQPIEEELYYAISNNGVIARFGVGYDNVNIKLATMNGVYCTNTPGVLDDCVAEHTLALILESCRQVGKMNNSMRNYLWQPLQGKELKNKTICIVGCGNIGYKTAKLLKRGFEMKINILAYDEHEKQILTSDPLFSRVLTDFAECVRNVDFVSLHIPASKENYHFLNASRLKKLSSKTIVINTSRGQVVSEYDLFNALLNNEIGGAALDVFEEEPYNPKNSSYDLRKLNNIILTPHVASNTMEACNRMAKCCLDNIKLAQNRKFNEMNLINPEILQK